MPVLDMTTTYVEPIFQDFQVEDLTPTEKKPEVILPKMAPLKSPNSHFIAGLSANLHDSNPYEHSPDLTDPYALIGGNPEEQEAGSGNGYE